MAMFSYECMNRSGEIIKGQLNAEEEAVAVIQLRKLGYSVLDLKKVNAISTNSILQFGQKVKDAELCLLSRQMSAMLAAGIPVTRALYTLAKQSVNPLLKKALEEIARNVESGMNLTEAMSSYPKIFSKLYISMIQAGEVGGNLEGALRSLSDQLQKDKALKDNIKSATFYPRMVAGFAILLLVAMLALLVPIFKGFFPEGTKLPVATKVIISISDSMRGQWYLWVLTIFVIIVGFISFVKSPMGGEIWEQFKFKVPAFGPLIHKSVMARFCRTLSTLLDGGIPVVQALESSGPTSGSALVNTAVKNASLRIQEGFNISTELELSGIFPPMVIQMIAVGEETGSLPSMLSQIAEFYEDEVAIMTKGLTALIEPIMLVTVGLVVGLMLVALYLPIFTSITQVGK